MVNLSEVSDDAQLNADIDDIDIDDIAEESLLDRLAGLADAIPLRTRLSLWSGVQDAFASGLSTAQMLGNVAWVVTTAAMVLVLPAALEMEKVPATLALTLAPIHRKLPGSCRRAKGRPRSRRSDALMKLMLSFTTSFGSYGNFVIFFGSCLRQFLSYDNLPSPYNIPRTTRVASFTPQPTFRATSASTPTGRHCRDTASSSYTHD